MLGMIPPHQGFETGHFLGLNIHDGLIIKFELTFAERDPQIGFEIAPPADLMNLRGIKHALGSASRLLRFVKGKVRILDDCISVQAVAGRKRNAHARECGAAAIPS